MTRAWRWALAVLAVIATLIAALLYEVQDQEPDRARDTSSSSGSADSAELLTALRRTANLPPCPQHATAVDAPKLRDVRVQCAGDGSDVDVARLVGGRPVVMNLWAYWCKPCADELPAMAEYQKQVGTDVLVVTVHQDERQAAALARLAELGVRLPTLQDSQRRMAAALGVPNVMPATVVFRLDGSVAKIIPQAFTSADEIRAAVDQALK